MPTATQPSISVLDEGTTMPSLYRLAEVYDAVVGIGPCEAFYREVVRCHGGPVLELACGTGRLTIPLAKDAEDVVGLDASPEMLAAAERKATEQGIRVELVQGDMRDFDLGRRFGVVIVSCNSLSHLTEPEDLRSCLAAIRRHLRLGGVVAFDVVLPVPRDLGPTGEIPRRLDLGPNPSSGLRAEEEVEYDPVRQLRTARWRVWPEEGAKVELAPMVQRQFFPQELPLLLEAADLELTARYGDFACNPLAAWSLNQVCLAHRSAGA